MAPLILSLMLDHPTFTLLDDLRQRHFPPERNMVPTHVTLFHALPGEQEASIAALLDEIAGATPPLPLALPGVRFLGRGVAVEIEAPGLVALRRRLAHAWQGWLLPQDQQGYRPHATIQNKVAPHVARRLYDELSGTWSQRAGQGLGLLLWRYLGGPWERAGAFPFAAGARPA